MAVVQIFVVAMKQLQNFMPLTHCTKGFVFSMLVPDFCRHLCCFHTADMLLTWTHSLPRFNPILALAVQNVDVTSADFTERATVSMPRLVNKQKFCFILKNIPEAFYFCCS